MTNRLTQKHLFKGIQDLEIVDSELKIRKKSPFKPAVHSSIPLAVLDPEPLLSPAIVSFASRVSGQTLVSLAIGKPDDRTFNDFVTELKGRVLAASGAASMQAADGRAAALDGNVQDMPSEFTGDDDSIPIRIRHEVKRDELEQAIVMLKTHLNDAGIEPFIEAMEELKSDPNDEARLIEVARLFAGLGIGQGAVLTYAPYLGFLLSDHPFTD
ncbi:MAG: hypothetical protein DWQ08_04355 [Proteobacteria bacterium]|nr:MAG: hypothetical protein DWQ08_04355 [Pseudomonadota bacterium]